MFDPVIDIFQHDDGVIDHQTNCEDKREQRQQVDGKSEQPQHRKGREQADGHGDRRNKRCAPAAQKQEDDQDNECRRFCQCGPHAADGLTDEQRVIRPNGNGHSLR